MIHFFLFGTEHKEKKYKNNRIFEITDDFLILSIHHLVNSYIQFL